ncbi:MAG: hypothetical protein D6732_21650 [Methanobacteriota archaeon]|nr:MAG: hypothetical protein D6732_21650 [Euryarchaeota archaeon]
MIFSFYEKFQQLLLFFGKELNYYWYTLLRVENLVNESKFQKYYSIGEVFQIFPMFFDKLCQGN